MVLAINFQQEDSVLKLGSWLRPFCVECACSLCGFLLVPRFPQSMWKKTCGLAQLATKLRIGVNFGVVYLCLGPAIDW